MYSRMFGVTCGLPKNYSEVTKGSSENEKVHTHVSHSKNGCYWELYIDLPKSK